MEGLGLKEKIAAAAREVLTTMAMLEVEAAEEPFQPDLCALSATIGLAGDLRGILSIHSPRPVALAVAGSLLGAEPEQIDDEVKDAFGEIANMVAGGLKTSLVAEKLALELAIPTTIAGQGYRVNAFSGARKLLVALTGSCGTFWIELQYKLDA